MRPVCRAGGYAETAPRHVATALPREAFGIGDGTGLVVFGDGLEVAHGDRRGGGGEYRRLEDGRAEAVRVRCEADELLAVLGQDDRLEDVESTQPTNLRLDDAGLRDGHHEALGHDVVAEKLREIRAVEGKKQPAAAQVFAATAEAPGAKTKLEFEKKGDLLVSKAPLPAGEGYQVVVQAKTSAEAKPKNFRIKLLTHTCGGCPNPEYACTCDE